MGRMNILFYYTKIINIDIGMGEKISNPLETIIL